MRTILVGTDTSAAADLAVEDAARLARDRGAELLVLYVQPESDLRAVVDPDRAADPNAYLARIPTRFPDVATRTRVERGEPADRICDVAAEELRRHDRRREPRDAGHAVARPRQRAEHGPATRAVLGVHRRHAPRAVRDDG